MIKLFLMFFRVGIFSYGGGLAMLPLIFQSVQDFGFMSAAEFSNLVALSQVTPGAIAVNAATFVGMDFKGVPGALFATLGVILPSFIVMQIAIRFLDKFNDTLAVRGSLYGMRAVVIGLIAAACIFVAQTTFTFALKPDNIILVAMMIVTIVLVRKTKISPIWMTVGMGVLGAILLHG